MIPQKKDTFQQTFIKNRIRHWDKIASINSLSIFSRHYHQFVINLFRFHIQPNQKILEIGCGSGELLAALNPSFGLGVDFSSKMIEKGVQNFPQLKFIHADITDIENLDHDFEVIILSDIINELWDIQEVFDKIKKIANPSTRIYINFFSHLWSKPLEIAQKIGVISERELQNWVTVEDIENLFKLSGLETIKKSDEYLLPINILGVSTLFNRYLSKLPVFRYLDLIHFITARTEPDNRVKKEYSVSIIVAARNESGNIAEIFKRVPLIGKYTELIFVEGGSTDNSFETIQNEMKNFPHLNPKLLKQDGKGKGDAVRKGFEAASGDILMILDADMTVPPEELPKFYEAIATNKGEFINGVRLVYPMEEKAMRFLNLLGNKFFSLAFSWLLGQPIKDTLCGTKVLWKKDYIKIAANRRYFGDFDPFGDFDLLFGASKLNLKIVEIPIRYRERKYGETNISRFHHVFCCLKWLYLPQER